MRGNFFLVFFFCCLFVCLFVQIFTHRAVTAAEVHSEGANEMHEF